MKIIDYRNSSCNKIFVLITFPGDWGLGIGDWGFGDWAQSPIPNPQIYKLFHFVNQEQ